MKYILTGKRRVTKSGVDYDNLGDEIELVKEEGERLVRLGACYPQGYKLAVTPQAPVQLTFFDAIKKALENGKIIASGAPDIPYLEGLLGRDVTAKERDETWDEYKTSMDVE